MLRVLLNFDRNAEAFYSTFYLMCTWVEMQQTKDLALPTINALTTAISKIENGEWRNGERGTGNGVETADASLSLIPRSSFSLLSLVF